jgi:nucleoside 2-deoxyribosyltransferase
MKVYLAGKADDCDQFSKLAHELREVGAEVVSSWHESEKLAELLDQRFHATVARNQAGVDALRNILSGQSVNPNPAANLPDGIDGELKTQMKRSEAEIGIADWVIADAYGAAMEAGYALALKKNVIMFGGLPSALSYACSESAVDLATACAVLLRKTSPFRRPLPVQPER